MENTESMQKLISLSIDKINEVREDLLKSYYNADLNEIKAIEKLEEAINLLLELSWQTRLAKNTAKNLQRVFNNYVSNLKKE